MKKITNALPNDVVVAQGQICGAYSVSGWAGREAMSTTTTSVILSILKLRAWSRGKLPSVSPSRNGSSHHVTGWWNHARRRRRPRYCWADAFIYRPNEAHQLANNGMEDLVTTLLLTTRSTITLLSDSKNGA